MLILIGIIFLFLCFFKPNFIAVINKDYYDISLIFVGMLMIYMGGLEKDLKKIKKDLAELKNKKEEEKK